MQLLLEAIRFWNVKMPDFDMAYFLGWFKGNKYAYAPSAGGTPIQEADNVSTIREALNQFNALSARENRCKDSIEELTGRNTELALDPTLLLTQKEWQDKCTRTILFREIIFFYYSWAYNSDVVNKKVAELQNRMISRSMLSISSSGQNTNRLIMVLRCARMLDRRLFFPL